MRRALEQSPRSPIPVAVSHTPESRSSSPREACSEICEVAFLYTHPSGEFHQGVPPHAGNCRTAVRLPFFYRADRARWRWRRSSASTWPPLVQVVTGNVCLVVCLTLTVGRGVFRFAARMKHFFVDRPAHLYAASRSIPPRILRHEPFSHVAICRPFVQGQTIPPRVFPR